MLFHIILLAWHVAIRYVFQWSCLMHHIKITTFKTKSKLMSPFYHRQLYRSVFLYVFFSKATNNSLKRNHLPCFVNFKFTNIIIILRMFFIEIYYHLNISHHSRFSELRYGWVVIIILLRYMDCFYFCFPFFFCGDQLWKKRVCSLWRTYQYPFQNGVNS